MKNKLVLLIIFPVIFLSCNRKQIKPNVTTKNFAVFIPSYLQPSSELLDTAILQYADTNRSFYVAIEKQPVSNNSDEEFYKNNIYSLFDFIDNMDTTTLIVNNQKAKNIFIEEEADNIYDWNIRIFKKDKDYYIIWIWTTKDDYAKNEEDINKIADSFKFN